MSWSKGFDKFKSGKFFAKLFGRKGMKFRRGPRPGGGGGFKPPSPPKGSIPKFKMQMPPGKFDQGTLDLWREAQTTTQTNLLWLHEMEAYPNRSVDDDDDEEELKFREEVLKLIDKMIQEQMMIAYVNGKELDEEDDQEMEGLIRDELEVAAKDAIDSRLEAIKSEIEHARATAQNAVMLASAGEKSSDEFDVSAQLSFETAAKDAIERYEFLLQQRKALQQAEKDTGSLTLLDLGVLSKDAAKFGRDHAVFHFRVRSGGDPKLINQETQELLEEFRRARPPGFQDRVSAFLTDLIIKEDD